MGGINLSRCYYLVLLRLCEAEMLDSEVRRRSVVVEKLNAVNLLVCRLPLYIRHLGVGKLEDASLAINPLHKECMLSRTPYDNASSPFLLLVAAEKAVLSSSYLSAQALDELPIWKVYSEVRKWHEYILPLDLALY